ncbi:MAG: hypothetical protein P8Y44_04395 [Acidobacteriota bacterium]
MRLSTRDLPLQKLLVEIFSIVLGVLLALAMNQWRESRSQRAQADTALANIVLEIRSNRELLAQLHDNNAKALHEIGAAAEDESEQTSFVPGLQLQDVAWNTLLTTGVSGFVDYQIILGLAETYSIQSVYKDLGRQIIEAELSSAAYSVAAGTTIDEQRKLREFSGFLELLVAIENQLLASYEEALAVAEGS